MTLTAARNGAAGGTVPIAPTQYIAFDGLEPTSTSGTGGRSWRVRAQNLVLNYSELAADETQYQETGQEHVVLVVDGTTLSVTAAQEAIELRGPGVIVVPPGRSSLVARTAGAILRLLSVEDGTDVRSVNADAYATADPRVAPAAPWPPPAGGYRLRAYALEDHPPEEGRFGSIFRTASFMVNFLDPQQGPRDAEQLTPHHHDDFEQCSVAVAGEWVHHVRTPWGPRRSAWREDEHHRIGSPSITVIPPPTVHTSEAIGPGINRLIDVFSPPRVDFSLKPGWVLNADDYPAPRSLGPGS